VKRIIHLSDLHVDIKSVAPDFESYREYYLSETAAYNYIILITGDIADNANHPDKPMKLLMA